MRGKAPAYDPKQANNRITPAYAGKSVSYEKLPSVNKDHPRLCGEKLHITERFRNDQGSPPPMRGKASKYKQFVKNKRITPAYAGKRNWSEIPP